MHICVGKLTTIGSYNGLSPGRRQAIIWTIAGILLIGPLGTNFSEILNGIQTFSFKKMHLQMSSAKWRPSCLGLNVLNYVSKGVLNTITDTIYPMTNSTSRKICTCFFVFFNVVLSWNVQKFVAVWSPGMEIYWWAFLRIWIRSEWLGKWAVRDRCIHIINYICTAHTNLSNPHILANRI